MKVIASPKQDFLSRDASLDLMKFFAISLVVLDHCMMRNLSNWSATPAFNILWLLQMPLFMLVSGCLSSSNKQIKDFFSFLSSVFKKALFYLWPCFTFLLFQTFCFGQFNNDLGFAFVSFFEDPDFSLWFLWVLFWIVFLFDIGVFISHKMKGFLKAAIPLFVCFLFFVLFAILIKFGIVRGTFLGIKYITYYMPFYCLGFVFRLVKKSSFSLKKSFLIFKSILFLLSLAFFTFEVFYFESIFSFPDSGTYLVLRVLGSFCGCYVCFVLAEFLCKFSFFVYLSKGGRFTLEIYYFHLLFISVLPPLSNASAIIQWGYVFAYWLLLMAISFIAIIVLYFVPFSHFAFFGKSWSYYLFERQFFGGLERKMKWCH